jgi:ribose transport system permease protein
VGETRLVQHPGARRIGVSRDLLVSLIPYALVPALALIGAATIDGYATKSSLISLLILSSFLGLASLGQTFTVIVGGVDLSIPSVIGMADVVITQLVGDHWPFGLAAVLIFAIAVVIGAANAIASLSLRVHPLIVTLGMGLIVTGGVLVWSHDSISGSVPQWLVTSVSVIGKTGPIPIPAVVIVWALVSAITIFLQRSTRLGREIYATGANPMAARLALVRSRWALISAFVVSAVLAAVVGILFAGYSGAADDTVGQPYLFETITAVVVGGTSLLGGRGGYGRTIAGALIISQLTTLLVGLGFGPSMQEVLLGILIILLVIIYGRESHVSTRV